MARVTSVMRRGRVIGRLTTSIGYSAGATGAALPPTFTSAWPPTPTAPTGSFGFSSVPSRSTMPSSSPAPASGSSPISTSAPAASSPSTSSVVWAEASGEASSTTRDSGSAALLHMARILSLLLAGRRAPHGGEILRLDLGRIEPVGLLHHLIQDALERRRLRLLLAARRWHEAQRVEPGDHERLEVSALQSRLLEAGDELVHPVVELEEARAARHPHRDRLAQRLVEERLAAAHDRHVGAAGEARS